MSSAIENLDLSDDEKYDSDMSDSEKVSLEDQTVLNENLELLIDIAHLCQNAEKVENIFLLGMSGAGKSALVNTLIKVIAGQYIPRAKVGAGVTASKTLTLQRYPSCGVRKVDITHGCQRDLVLPMLPRLPTIIDAAGRGDMNTEAFREVLELIIGGYIPPGTSIEYLEELQKEHSVGALRDVVYTKANPEWRVTKVVFVQGCHDVIPKNLVECLHSILNKIDPKTGQPLYTGDVHLVITKYDLVQDQSKYKLEGKHTDEVITMAEFHNVEKKLAELFNIQGALNDNRTRWVSYTDRGSNDNPYIDNIALKFIKSMVLPGTPPVETIGPVMTRAIKLELEIKKIIKKHPLNVGSFVCAFIAFIIMLLLYRLFTAPL